MSATYAIYTSPTHKPIPDHLPTLIITPHGKPQQILYTYLHTNYNRENYLLTPSDQGDLCVAKLFPPPSRRISQGQPGGATPGSSDRQPIRCEASRNLRWTIRNEGIQNPVYKLTLPNPENPQIEQPLFQVSKPNPNCPWWTLFYFTYAGHLIPPKRIEFGRLMKSPATDPRGGSGETKITVTGKTEEEKAVWKTLGEGNEDMVEWILLCASMNVLDDEIARAAEVAGVRLASGPASAARPLQAGPTRQLHPTGNSQRPPAAAPIRPAVYNAPPSNRAQQPTRPPPPGASGPPRSGPGQPVSRNHSLAGAPPPPAGVRPYNGPPRNGGPMPISREGSTSSHSHSHDSLRRTPPTHHPGSDLAYHSSVSSRPMPQSPRPAAPQGSRPMLSGVPGSSRHAPPPHHVPSSPHRPHAPSSPRPNHATSPAPRPHYAPPSSHQHFSPSAPRPNPHNTPLAPPSSRPGLRAMAQASPPPPQDHTSPLRVKKVR